MKVLYLECNMGAAGDMLMAALWELAEDKQAFMDKMNHLLPGVKVNALSDVKCGITGTHMQVLIDGEEEGCEQEEHAHHTHEPHTHSHSHTDMHEIRHRILQLNLPEKVKEDALSVYRLIAEAESHAHGRPVEEIHFHEVGTADAIVDIVGVCLLMEELGADKILVSPVHVGNGQVHCAHGVLPVPAPATAHILRDVPVYGGDVQGELCTPTGAALLKYFASDFGSMPVMRISRIGYGMGKKNFKQANCVRAMLGTMAEDTQEIVELCCNLDDMTPEELGFVQERLFAEGALDVYTTAVGMKKSRPGVLLTCMCRSEDRETMLRLLFMHTSSLGVRETICNRYTLNRREYTADTPYGGIRIKEAEGFGIRRRKPEYEDIARIAREQNMSLQEVRGLLK